MALASAPFSVLENSQFLSPIDGQIVDLPIRVGQTISIGQKVAGIVDMRTLKIRTGVGENAIGTVYKGQIASITYKNFPDIINAKVTGVGYKPLPSIATYPVEIEIDNKELKLYPGMVVSGEILNYVNKNVIYILFNNIIKEYDHYYLYTVNEDNIVEKKEVTLGKQINEYIIIESGLTEGDRVIIEGYDKIQDRSRVIVKTFENEVEQKNIK